MITYPVILLIVLLRSKWPGTVQTIKVVIDLIDRVLDNEFRALAGIPGSRI